MSHAPGGSAPAAGGTYVDPLSAGADLKRLYDEKSASADPAERAVAGRAWAVCMPAFLGPGNRPARVESLAASFPQGPEAASRLESLRLLEARCRGFFDRSGDELGALVAQNTARFRAGYFSSHAERARSDLLAGNRSEALVQIREAFRSGDPYELKELAGLVALWHRGAEPGGTDAVRDAALAVVGCDLGMDCGADSVLGLELCALHGACQGDVAERLLADYVDVDHQQVNEERRRLALAIMDGNVDFQSYFGD
jgi:hypothetical protein